MAHARSLTVCDYFTDDCALARLPRRTSPASSPLSPLLRSGADWWAIGGTYQETAWVLHSVDNGSTWSIDSTFPGAYGTGIDVTGDGSTIYGLLFETSANDDGNNNYLIKCVGVGVAPAVLSPEAALLERRLESHLCQCNAGHLFRTCVDARTTNRTRWTPHFASARTSLLHPRSSRAGTRARGRRHKAALRGTSKGVVSLARADRADTPRALEGSRECRECGTVCAACSD